MSVTGPYNSPLALGVRPWGCLFFSFWAFFIISFAVQGFLLLVDPAFMEAVIVGESEEGLRGTWTVILIGYATTIFLTMVWAEQIGAGPFAASMKVDTEWVLMGLIGGPFVLNGATILVGLVVSGDGGNWQLRDSDDAKAFSDAATAGWAFVFTVVLAAPILEEVAYRGIGLGCLLSRGWDAWGSTFIVTLLFTLMHMHLTPAALIPIFVTGLFFAFLRIRSGSLVPSIIAHMAANLSVLLL